MRKALGHANNSEYFLYQSPEDWIRNDEGTIWQKRIYWIGRYSQEVRTDAQMQALGFPQHWSTIPIHFAHCNGPMSSETFERKCFVAPADWFPGICDAWVQAHAADVEITSG